MAEGLNISSGMNTGEAQVFNFGNKTPALDYSIRQKERDLGFQNQREADAYKKLGSLDKLDIFYRDQPIFKDKINSLRDYTKTNIDKLRKGDAESTMQFQNMVTDIYNEANLSKIAKENFQKFGFEVMKNQDKYDETTFSYLDDFANAPGYYGFDSTQLVQNIDLMDDIKSNITINPTSTGYEYIDKNTGNKISGTSKIVTQKEADDILEKRLFSNPQIYQSAVRQYEKAKNKGATKTADVVSWYKELGRPYLVQKDTKYSSLPSGKSKGYSFGSGTASNDMYNFVYSTNNTAGSSTSEKIIKKGKGVGPLSEEIIDIASINTPENPYLIIGGKEMTPQQLKNTGDGWKLIGFDKNGKELKPIPIEDVEGDFEANYFISPKNLIENLKKDGATQTNVKDMKKQPKEQGGNANKIQVKRKSDGLVGWISKDAYEAYKNKYEIVK